MSKKTEPTSPDVRKKEDERFSDPIPVLVKDKDDNILSGTKEQFERWEREAEGIRALGRGDRKTYIDLVWGGVDPAEEVKHQKKKN